MRARSPGSGPEPILQMTTLRHRNRLLWLEEQGWGQSLGTVESAHLVMPAPQVFLGEVNSGISSTQVVVKELKVSASVQEQMQFLEEAQPYRWVAPGDRLSRRRGWATGREVGLWAL